MPPHRKHDTLQHEAQIQEAVEELKNGTYNTPYEAELVELVHMKEKADQAKGGKKKQNVASNTDVKMHEEEYEALESDGSELEDCITVLQA